MKSINIKNKGQRADFVFDFKLILMKNDEMLKPYCILFAISNYCSSRINSPYDSFRPFKVHKVFVEYMYSKTFENVFKMKNMFNDLNFFSF